jgi:hypothetical protein
MNRNLFWRFIFFVVLPLVLAVKFMYPPSPRDLLLEFNRRAVTRDATFTEIVQQAQALEKAHPGRTYANLQESIGTNDIARYFPFFDTKTEVHPTIAILNRLQREAAGKIRKGLDLQGAPRAVEVETNLDAPAPAAEVRAERMLVASTNSTCRAGDAAGGQQPDLHPTAGIVGGGPARERDHSKSRALVPAGPSESRTLLESGELVRL